VTFLCAPFDSTSRGGVRVSHESSGSLSVLLRSQRGSRRSSRGGLLRTPSPSSGSFSASLSNVVTRIPENEGSENMTSRARQVPLGDARPDTVASRLRDGLKRSRKGSRVEIVADGFKSDAHLIYMREFLAPLLAGEFLRQRHAASTAPTSELNTLVSTIEPSIRRGGR
jgi:hypothetical protein